MDYMALILLICVKIKHMLYSLISLSLANLTPFDIMPRQVCLRIRTWPTRYYDYAKRIFGFSSAHEMTVSKQDKATPSWTFSWDSRQTSLIRSLRCFRINVSIRDYSRVPQVRALVTLNIVAYTARDGQGRLAYV